VFLNKLVKDRISGFGLGERSMSVTSLIHVRNKLPTSSTGSTTVISWLSLHE
jgi:hypothetical protein